METRKNKQGSMKRRLDSTDAVPQTILGFLQKKKTVAWGEGLTDEETNNQMMEEHATKRVKKAEEGQKRPRRLAEHQDNKEAQNACQPPFHGERAGAVESTGLTKPIKKIVIKLTVKKDKNPAKDMPMSGTVDEVSAVRSQPQPNTYLDLSSESDADDVGEAQAKRLYDPITGLDVGVSWNRRRRKARADEIAAEFAGKGVNFEEAAAKHWTLRQNQNCILILLDEDRGMFLNEYFLKSKYWEVLKEIFPYGVSTPGEQSSEDLCHIYTEYGVGRQFMLLDLDFMPGVTVEKIQQSMTLHFDPKNRLAMFDMAQIPRYLQCQEPPVIIKPYKFKKFEEMHEEWAARFGESSTEQEATPEMKVMLEGLKNDRLNAGLGIKDEWDEQSSWSYLRVWHSGPGGEPPEFINNFRQMDWTPKDNSADRDVEEIDPIDPSGVSFKKLKLRRVKNVGRK
ncbi:hypothetical protein EG329_006781 [Mollisiaceae sp. DMI_Dod_QoI]|nr:hypothetical protein EG329_006781 [Helotiales sp. DMI_Dod_QoI]